VGKAFIHADPRVDADLRRTNSAVSTLEGRVRALEEAGDELEQPASPPNVNEHLGIATFVHLINVRMVGDGQPHVRQMPVCHIPGPYIPYSLQFKILQGGVKPLDADYEVIEFHLRGSAFRVHPDATQGDAPQDAFRWASWLYNDDSQYILWYHAPFGEWWSWGDGYFPKAPLSIVNTPEGDQLHLWVGWRVAASSEWWYQAVLIGQYIPIATTRFPEPELIT